MHLLAAQPGGFVDEEGIVDLAQTSAPVVILTSADSRSEERRVGKGVLVHVMTVRGPLLRKNNTVVKTGSTLYRPTN